MDKVNRKMNGAKYGQSWETKHRAPFEAVKDLSLGLRFAYQSYNGMIEIKVCLSMIIVQSKSRFKSS